MKIKKKNDHDALMRAARLRVANMDAVDGSNVALGPIDMSLRTVMCALSCAIKSSDWSVVADAQVMLSQIELRYRPADLKDRTGNDFYLKEKS